MNGCKGVKIKVKVMMIPLSLEQGVRVTFRGKSAVTAMQPY